MYSIEEIEYSNSRNLYLLSLFHAFHVVFNKLVAEVDRIVFKK